MPACESGSDINGGPNRTSERQTDRRQTDPRQSDHGTGQPDNGTDDWQVVPDEVRVDARRAAIGGALAVLVTLIGAWLVGAVLIYLLLNVPLGESDTASESSGFGDATLYYATLVLSSLLAGALIAVVLMFYNTMRDVIQAVGPKGIITWSARRSNR